MRTASNLLQSSEFLAAGGFGHNSVAHPQWTPRIIDKADRWRAESPRSMGQIKLAEEIQHKSGLLLSRKGELRMKPE